MVASWRRLSVSISDVSLLPRLTTREKLESHGYYLQGRGGGYGSDGARGSEGSRCHCLANYIVAITGGVGVVLVWCGGGSRKKKKRNVILAAGEAWALSVLTCLGEGATLGPDARIRQ